MDPKSESAAKRSRFQYLQKNKRLDPMMLHSHEDAQTDFASETSYFNSRTDSHSGSNSISGVNPDSVTGAN